MQVWPAIDLRGGQCVRLRQGDYQQETVYGADPLEMAQRWVSQGAQRLHLVDLDGARDGQLVNREAIVSITREVEVPCQVGGGIRDEATIEELLNLGVMRLVVGTKALTEPDWFRAMCQRFPGRLALGIDARNGQVATDGWLKTSEMSAVELARQFEDDPIAAIIYTDISKDGMLSGPNLTAMSEMNRAVDVPVIASGGVTTLDDVRQLHQCELEGCIIGRSLYEGKLDLAEVIAVAEPSDPEGV